MSRTTPRSINIREMERAKGHLEDACIYFRRYMESLKAGMEQYEQSEYEAPDIYINHMDKMITLHETLDAAKEVLDKIITEL